VNRELSLGAGYLGANRCQFCVWAPFAEKVEVHTSHPQDRIHALRSPEHGYHYDVLEGITPGTLYRYRLDEEQERADPASRFQPHGVHGPSQVMDTHFLWDDHIWYGIPLEDYIIYELHVALFTAEGTFETIIPRLDQLKDLGITAIELMPVAQFPGERNWGYDGAYPFAVQGSYGGPVGLKTLVDSCHQRGLAAVLDVVYNHLGPEGNYLADFGPYFTDRYQTPWGPAINFDGPHSDDVRRFFIENALYWITEFHIDALRIDAVHAIMDFSAQPFLEEMASAVHQRAHELNRQVHLIAESALNDTRLIRSRERGGYALDALWNDDFHHALHTLLTGEQSGYYQDFGEFQQLVKAFREGFVYSGQYSDYRQRRHGNTSRGIQAQRFVVFSQNHDQVGNRMLGERLTALLPFEALKLCAGAVLLSPFIPMLFMGEEYGEEAPFLYFVSHSDPGLIEAVYHGRKEEFQEFQWQGEPPVPQDSQTFLRCKLKWEERYMGKHKVLCTLYRQLIGLRKAIPALSYLSKDNLEVSGMEEERLLLLHRWYDQSHVFCVMNFNPTGITARLSPPKGRWKKVIDSSERKWKGPGSLIPKTWESGAATTIKPLSFAVFEEENLQ
jgi:maltooligosyltrehalose trehalohydrolase